MQRVFFAICASLALAGCGGGGGFSQTPYNPNAIVPSTPSIVFTSGSAQTFTISEPGYNGIFTGATSNPSVAVVSLTNSQSSARVADATTVRRYDTQATVTVTPVGGGTATISVSDANGHVTNIPVTVTSGTFTPQLHR